MSDIADVYVIGTNHHFQTTRRIAFPEGPVPEAQIQAFKTLLHDACACYRIQAIAEEMSLEALNSLGQSESTCKQVADIHHLPHRYCDPETATRERLGIWREADIHMEVFFAGDDDRAIASRTRAEHEKRERYWLEELTALEKYPVLFICGAKHARPFTDLVASSGLRSKLLCEEWGSQEN